MEPTKTVNLDGVSYDVDTFSPGIQQAIQMFNAFQVDLQREQLAVLKTQSALQIMGTQIGDAIKAELESRKASEAGESESSETAETLSNGEDKTS